ncbi:sugar ABC transporter permease [Cohnella sp. LGH]|uniref:carbohydrate ABC transporter permease n=1 Tax=Cohnella sp. LGH TaxID=1619153 RepID=UPI001ADBAFEF|nr:sugar ABC transporter permease [Cohnella sp. LGH]QTH40347.1 sugar ABC transporter permease [Cohnella sp. LGH]
MNQPRLGSTSRFRLSLRRNRDGVIGYSILFPVLLGFAIFSVFPALFVVYLSFAEWNGLEGGPIWVGLKNYVTFFNQGDYLASLARAGVYGLICLFFTTVLGFLIAVLLNQKVIGSSAIRTIWYLPALVPFAVISQMAVAVLNPVDGLLKQMMVRFGMEPIVFQTSALWMSFWIILLTVWKGVGGTVVIYLAGLQGIDTTLYEAARVDGASKAKTLWHVTIPSLRPITMFVLVTGIIGSFQIFEPVQLISRGGPNGETNIILYRIYQDAFQGFSFGMASASSVMVLLATLVFTIMQYRNSKRGIV